MLRPWVGAPLGRQLKGLKVLVVGWGNIARELAAGDRPTTSVYLFISTLYAPLRN